MGLSLRALDGAKFPMLFLTAHLDDFRSQQLSLVISEAGQLLRVPLHLQPLNKLCSVGS